MFLDELKRFEAEGAQLEELVFASALAKATLNQYNNLQIPAPDWLVDTDATITRKVDGIRRDMLLKRARVLKGQLENYKSPETKQQEIQKELDAINQALQTS